MANKVIHKRSIQKGLLPSGTTLDYGEIAVNYNSSEPFLSIRTTESGKTDTKYAKFIDEATIDAKIKNVENQNAFSKVAVSGKSTIEADSATDTLTFAAGSNISITTDASNDKITIAATGLSKTGHTHDDRYYTESETNALLNKKSDTGHTHSQYSETGHTHDGVYKPVQDIVSDPTASTATTTTFIDTISQNENGVITATKKTVNFSNYKPVQTAVTDPNAGSNFSKTFISTISQDKNGVITATKNPVQLSNALTFGTKSYDGSSAQTITVADLGLSAALKYCGITTTALTDGATTNPIKINNANHTATAGCVVFYGDKEFVFNGTNWELLGAEATYKVVQTAVSDPTASTATTTTFISNISQDKNGVITPTKKTLPTATSGATGIAKLVTGDLKDKVYADGEAAAAAHTHDSAYVSKQEFEDQVRMQYVTYSQLKELRDFSQLVPGQQYRITDYITTTTQANTQSAGHQFDIIVTADDSNTLNEVARARHRQADTYFANSDLNAWQIWYSLDNDTNRFAWADATNGKGVIYRMIDEFNNDVAYDFKNIQFKHPNNPDDTNWYYTFDASSTDATVSNNTLCVFNVIKPYFVNNKVQQLNNNIFIVLTKCVGNVFQNNCYNNNFGDNAIGNKFDVLCYNNSFSATGCQLNSFGGNSYNNKFLGKTQKNTIKQNCRNNTFGGSCLENIIGPNCFANIVGDNCCDNNISAVFQNNTIGSVFKQNTVFSTVLKNTIGNNFIGNFLNANVQRNVFGNDYIGNHFSINVVDNVFGDNFQHNTFNTGCFNLNIGNNFQRNTFAERLNNINIVNTESEDTPIQNYKFCAGISGTEESPTNINCVRNVDYETKVAKNSNGKILTYCEADLIAVPLTLISFEMFGLGNYQAEEGMTWGEWVNSEYNTLGYKINADSNITSGTAILHYLNNSDYRILASDLIQSDGQYRMMHEGGSDD